MPQVRVTFSCGHEGSIEVQGRRADRESKAVWLAERRTCQSCYNTAVEKQRAEAREKATLQAAEFELPTLLGTEAQIEWAMRIRAEVVAIKDAADVFLSKAFEGAFFMGFAPERAVAEFEEGFNALVGEQRAAWWIESGRQFIQSEAEPFVRAVVRRQRSAADSGSLRTTVVRPEGREPISVVSLTHTDSAVCVYTSKRESDTFIDLLKDIGFRWESGSNRWQYEAMPSSSPIEHVSAGIASEILAARYAVSVSSVIGELLASGEYEPENPRLVLVQKNGGSFLLRWRRSDDLYAAVKSLPGARWSGGFMAVPRSSATEVVDLAERLGFWISTAAEDAIASVDTLVVAGKAVQVGAPARVVATAVQGGVRADLVDH